MQQKKSQEKQTKFVFSYLWQFLDTVKMFLQYGFN